MKREAKNATYDPAGQRVFSGYPPGRNFMRNTASGLRNFRDFGTSASVERLPLPSGELYRSGHLARLDEQSRERLVGHDWKLIVDLRYPDEQKRDPSPWPTDRDMTCLRIASGSSRDAPHFEMFIAARSGGTTMDEVYTSFYRELPFDPLYRPFFADAIREIARARGPILIHCTAGKDRTGILVAMLLDLLGVDAETIRADYLKSSSIVTPEFTQTIGDQIFDKSGERLSESEIRAMLAVAPAYLDAALGAIRAAHGSVERYFIASGLTPSEIEAVRRRSGMSEGQC